MDQGLWFCSSGLNVSSQMVGKMGGDSMSHINASSGGVEPALYYQKRPGEDAGEHPAVSGGTVEVAEPPGGAWKQAPPPAAGSVGGANLALLQCLISSVSVSAGSQLTAIGHQR